MKILLPHVENLIAGDFIVSTHQYMITEKECIPPFKENDYYDEVMDWLFLELETEDI